MKTIRTLGALILVSTPILSLGDGGNGQLQQRVELLEVENALQQVQIDQNTEDISELSSGGAVGNALVLVDSNGTTVGHLASFEFLESSNSRNAAVTVRFPTGDGHAFGRFHAVRPFPEDSTIFFAGPDCAGPGYSQRGAGGTDFLEQIFVGRAYMGLDANGREFFHSATYEVGSLLGFNVGVSYGSAIEFNSIRREWRCNSIPGTVRDVYEVNRVETLTIEERFPPPYSIETR